MYLAQAKDKAKDTARWFIGDIVAGCLDYEEARDWLEDECQRFTPHESVDLLTEIPEWETDLVFSDGTPALVVLMSTAVFTYVECILANLEKLVRGFQCESHDEIERTRAFQRYLEEA